MTSHSGLHSPDAIFAGPGEIRALCRSLDWSATPLGPVELWPMSLRLAVRMCLDARIPMTVWAGPELVLIYNHGYPAVLGPGRHPWALGRPAREVWADLWDRLGPELERVIGHGESTAHEDERFVLDRGGPLPEECYFTYSFTPIQEADGRIVGALNVFVETTERVRSLGEHQARSRAVFENAGDAIIITDPAGAGRVISANPAACRLFGYGEEEFRQVDRAAMVDVADPALERVLRDRDEHQRAAAVLTYRRKDGTTFRGELRAVSYLDARGERKVQAIIRDVTERERSEAALRRALAEAEEGRRTLQALMENVPEGITIAEGEDVTIRMVSRHGQELLGGPHNLPAEEVARRWTVYRPDGKTILPPDELPLVRAVRQGETIRDAEVVQEASDGRRLHLLCNAAPIRDAEGRILGGIVAWQEVSERRRAEEALRDSDRRKTEFLAVLSHELRNPLSPIKNSLYVLSRAAPGGDQARRAQEIIARQVDQLARLVDDLLDVTRIARNKVQLQRQRLELGELLHRTLEDHRSLFDRAGLRLELHPAPGPVFVRGDWNRLAQVIGNLLHNSAKFTPAGGRVDVTLASDPDRHQIALRVADTGAGMAPELLARLFEPFMQAERTLDRTRGGLGLGLSLVKGLVELHGGEVTAASPGPGAGSTFTIRLPMDQADAPGDRSAPARGIARRRILVIEDNVDAAESLRELLEFEDQEVAVAYNGPDGLARARELRPDLVLCDIGLPGMDGFEVARLLRADGVLSRARLVALSGYALPEDLERAKGAGFDRHLSKPPSLEQLRELLGPDPWLS